MKTRKNTAVLLACFVTVNMACTDQSPEVTTETQSSAVLIWMPRVLDWYPIMDLSGHGLNGVSMNGEVLDGQVVTSVSLVAVESASGKTKTLSLKATKFTGGFANSGVGVVGAVFNASLGDGSPVLLRIEGMSPGPASEGGGFRYEVSYSTTEGWRPLCGADENDDPILAIPLNGVWSYVEGEAGGGGWTDSKTLFTFACEGFALAKCVAMGYPPWVEGKICDSEAPGKSRCVKTTLREHHLACARALRADYCGDGTSFTQDGVPVSLFDGIGIRSDGEEWALEAEWDSNGARCVETFRTPETELPACLVALAKPDCGDPAHFESGATLVTEVEDVP